MASGADLWLIRKKRGYEMNWLDLNPGDPAWGHHFTANHKDNERLHYVRRGDKTKEHILLVHAYPGFWYDWRRIFPVLSEDYDVIAVDSLGFGQSDKPDYIPEEGYCANAHGERLLALLNELGIDNCYVMSYDGGARPCMVLMAIAPERVKGAVFGGPPYPGFGERKQEPSAQKEFFYHYFLNLMDSEHFIGHDRETVKYYMDYFYSHWVGNKEALREAEYNYILDEFAKKNGMRGYVRWYCSGSSQAVPKPKAAPSLEKWPVTHPVRVFWGEQNPVLPARWSDRMDHYFTNYTLEILSGVGHFIPWEAPEKMIDACRELIAAGNR